MIPRSIMTRREALASSSACLSSLFVPDAVAASGVYRLATFTAEVTPPLGHPLMGGGIAPAAKVADPLFAHGLVLIGSDKPVVLAAVDWCEIRNDAYERWRRILSEAAGTLPERVLVTSLHQHDAPIADLEAQRILEKHKGAGRICDLDYHERTVQRVAKALRDSLQNSQPITHIGTGQSKVEKVASNRRSVRNGVVAFDRTSATSNPEIRGQPEGTIDPWLKTLSFWSGDRPLAAVSCYATHPMSYYGKGEVSSDFVGLARKRRQADDPSIFQVYVSGCSGNVTAGKYNDGAPGNRPVLADRIYQAMVLAWKSTRRQPLQNIGLRVVPLRLEPRNGPGFTTQDLQKRLVSDPKPFGQCLAALGLSWRKRVEARHVIDLPIVNFGPAQLVLLPGESYVEFQLLAQKLSPQSFVITMGYGESATGYIPIEKAFEEGDTNLRDWCWVAPGSEQVMNTALKEAFKAMASVE